MKNSRLMATITALSIVAGSAVYAEHDDQNSTKASSAFNDVQRGSRLLGMEVRDNADKKVGDIDDLVVDLESGRVLYAVVDVGRERIAMPPGVFSRVGSSAADVNVSRDQMDSAPKFTSDNADQSELGKASFVSQVHRHFNQNAWWQGDKPADQGSFNNTHRLTNLRAAKVKNVADEDMGKISNMAIDLPAGRIVYVLLSPAPSLDLGDALYALPPSLLTANKKYDDTTFSANIDRAKLAAGPHFNRDNWARLTDRAWAASVYSHYGKQVYFSPPGALEPTGRDSGIYRSDTGRATARDQVISRDRNARDDRDQTRNRGWNRGRTADRDRATLDRGNTVPNAQDDWDLDLQRNRAR